MREVLQPLNEQACSVVYAHADLLDSTTISPTLLRFIAHVAANRVMMREWDRGNLGAFSTIAFPEELLGMANAEFKRLKALQARLLGIPSSVLEGARSRL